MLKMCVKFKELMNRTEENHANRKDVENKCDAKLIKIHPKTQKVQILRIFKYYKLLLLVEQLIFIYFIHFILYLNVKKYCKLQLWSAQDIIWLHKI